MALAWVKEQGAIVGAGEGDLKGLTECPDVRRMLASETVKQRTSGSLSP